MPILVRVLAHGKPCGLAGDQQLVLFFPLWMDTVTRNTQSNDTTFLCKSDFGACLRQRVCLNYGSSLGKL